MNRQRRLEQAQKNKQLCQQLFDEGKHYDWVITVAFYASIHFVEYKLLPATVNGILCKSCSDLRNAFKVNGRHEARSLIVSRDLRSVSSSYRWLDDQSRNARYITYKFDRAFAEKAIEHLYKIEALCIT